jgi:hypothetical protein
LICLKTECPVAWVVTRDEVFEVNFSLSYFWGSLLSYSSNFS